MANWIKFIQEASSDFSLEIVVTAEISLTPVIPKPCPNVVYDPDFLISPVIVMRTIYGAAITH